MKIYSNGLGLFLMTLFSVQKLLGTIIEKNLERSSIEFFLVYSSNIVVFLLAREIKFLHLPLKDKDMQKRAFAGESTELFQTRALGFLV